MDRKTLFTLFFLITLGIISRIIPHPPNFTALNSLSLFGTFFLGNFTSAALMLSSTLFLSDLLIGFHNTMPSTYLSFFIIAIAGSAFKKYTDSYPSLSLGIATLFFFILSNFGVWISSDLYQKSFEGLVLCYIAALPFLKYQLLGDLFYGTLLYFLYYKKYSDVKDIKDPSAERL
jgi:hypothetical protein